MLFTHVRPERIEAHWPAIAEILAPAMRNDPRQTMEGLHRRLAAGADSLLEITGPGRCLMVIEVDSEMACWTKYLAGNIEGGPRAKIEIIRGAVAHIERFAKEAGCASHRLCGRDWSRILPDYVPFEGYRNGLMKELR